MNSAAQINTELLVTLKRAVRDLTMTMLVMDAESRKITLELIKEYKQVIARAEPHHKEREEQGE